jgi:protein-L-isoaspartate O-methyltransferase
LPHTIARLTISGMAEPVQSFRAFFASYVVASAGSSDERVIDAFSAVARERFLGEGPWRIFVSSRYLSSGSGWWLSTAEPASAAAR